MKIVIISWLWSIPLSITINKICPNVPIIAFFGIGALAYLITSFLLNSKGRY